VHEIAQGLDARGVLEVYMRMRYTCSMFHAMRAIQV